MAYVEIIIGGIWVGPRGIRLTSSLGCQRSQYGTESDLTTAVVELRLRGQKLRVQSLRGQKLKGAKSKGAKTKGVKSKGTKSKRTIEGSRLHFRRL